jgi:predicted tellurium resistance membrane protein TerC
MKVWTQPAKRAREHLVALFGFAVLLLTPPVLLIFNKPVRIFGIPALYLYLFLVWAVLIALAALAAERSQASDDDAASESDGAANNAGAATGAPDA